jgi:hypothetical protein
MIMDLDEGEHVFQVRAIDNAGNSAEAVWEFKVDTIDPELNLSAPNQREIVQGAAVTIGWKVSDENGVREVNISVDGNPTIYFDDGEHGFLLQSGKHTINASVADIAGNIVFDNRSFVVDTDRPSILWNISTPDYISSQMVLLRWIEFDDTGITNRTVIVDGSPVAYPSSDEFILNLEEGGHVITVELLDIVSTGSSISWTLYVDWTPPELGELRYIKRERGFDIIGNFYDNGSGLELLRLSINGIFLLERNGNFSYHHEENVEGDIYVKVTVYDRAGHNSVFNVTIHEEAQKNTKNGKDQRSIWLVISILIVLFIFITIITITIYLKKVRVKNTTNTSEIMEKEEHYSIKSITKTYELKEFKAPPRLVMNEHNQLPPVKPDKQNKM